MLVTSAVDRKGRLAVPEYGDPIPVFRVMQPWMEPVASRSYGGPNYPAIPKREGATATLRFAATVDTTGRVDMKTVRLIDHEDQPGQTVLLIRHLAEFVREIEKHFSLSRYHPARIGGCLVRDGFTQQFEFKLDK